MAVALLQYFNTIQYNKTRNAPYVTRMLFVGAGYKNNLILQMSSKEMHDFVMHLLILH